jgi:5-methyltetrahydropteroyltriglutamate--homocysteine methyltransferase
VRSWEAFEPGFEVLQFGDVRHEHEYKVWRDVKLPARKILIRGVASHPTKLVEHPELIGDRIITFAEMVGQENVIAGTDCGPGATIHPQIAWAKLRDVHRTPFPTLNFEA